MIGTEPHEGLAQSRDEPSLLQHRGAQARHERAQGVGLLGKLFTDLGQDLHAAVHIARFDHEQRGLQAQ